jgi:hypothetical protein
MGRLGTLSFQANDNTDVFLIAPVSDLEDITSDEVMLGSNTEDLDMLPEWITGRLPKATQVTVDGDTTSLQCFYRAIEAQSFTLTVYVEYEEAEETSKVKQVQ